ncbi:hypothetical protein ACJMK2_033871 [Sinanodonta woodiana]|uniref:Zinc finger ZZ-type and EF-hand domain-containing protein 1 n=2 Tax=Sinanodonta woodiana TaxID=1069815 RepID=A0ABD3WTA0_SINWO
MGNSASSSDSEDDKELRQMDDVGSDNEETVKEPNILSDLETLFNHNSLRNLAAKIKEEIPENVIQQHRYQIVRWLDDRESKNEETVTLAQFCDMLMAKGVNRDEAIRSFQQFDTDGSGIVEVSTILTAIKSLNGPNMMGELGKSIRMLQACSLTPGFVDVYSEDKNAVSQHAEKILKYLLRNRAPSFCLPFPHLNGFNNTSSMRLSVLKSILNNLKEAARSDGAETQLSDGEEMRLLNPCYSSFEVSSNTSDAYRLTNGDQNSFWQSDGSARSHWIRLNMRSNVVIKTLAIAVASSDSSYMPEQVTVSAGRTIRNMHEIKEVRIPGHVTGDIVLLKNMKTHYPVVQINIKRCKNDGCDTRIHGLKAVGYRVVKEVGVSVGDASAMWFLQVLASSVKSSIPLAPHLRTSILAHSKKALEHIPPVSLSPASSEKPQFLSNYVLQEIEIFIRDMAVQDNTVLSDGLQILLAFNLARGHVGGLLRTLNLLKENLDMSFPITSLLLKLQTARDACWEKSGHQLSLSLCGCDGGQNDDQSKPENVLNQSWTPASPVYVSEEGKTKVNMFFKSSEYIQLTKIRIKVAPGVKGAKRGLVFVYRDSNQFMLNEQVQKFEQYDTWGKLEYNFCVQVRQAGIAGKPDNPVAYFSLEDDCDEIEIPVSWYPVGNYILVKLLQPRSDSAGKVGIVGIKFYGFTRKPILIEDSVEVKHPPNPEKKPSCCSQEIIQNVLTFLVDLTQDQALRKSSSTRPEFVDLSDLPLDVICELYDAFRDREDERSQACALSALQLVYCLLPSFSTLSNESKKAAESLFQHLCKVVDSPDIDKSSRHFRICKQLIIDGAAVFFSEKDARRKQLFEMMQKVETLSDTPSVMLVFQSLCQFFSAVDPRGLLDLPRVPPENFDPSSVLGVMETMVMVTYHELGQVIQTGHTNEQLIHLLQLVSSLQTSLLAWSLGQMIDSSDSLKNKGSQIATGYAINVLQKGSDACKIILEQDSDKLMALLPKLETSFFGSIVRQLVLIMTYLSSFCNSSDRVELLKSALPLNQNLTKLAAKLPEEFPDISSEHWASIQADDIILRTWEVESSHNYENNQHVTQNFNCPGATKFVIDFDQRCETERRYDYLVFTDSKGLQMRFDQKVGTPKWPRQVTFHGPHLHYLFHSDSSNVEWGYKFKVTARGSPDMPLTWPYDLQLGLVKLMGQLCGATLNANPVLPQDQLLELEEVATQDVLRSDLWTSLFRGGYMIGKLQRSLSGKFEAEESRSVLHFLWDMVNSEHKLPMALIKKCKEQSKSLQVGGDKVEAAIVSVFAALLWHTQQLRDDLEKYIRTDGIAAVSEGIFQAFVAAESIRMPLVNQRQRMAVESEQRKGEEDEPAIICKDKALFLLKFAGLTKTQLKQEFTRPKSTKLRKLSNRKYERQISKYETPEKYPSFRLVLEFVQDPAWNTERVNHMLQERSQHAQAVADVYVIAAEIVRTLTNEHPFQIGIVLFLQEMLICQDGFAKHYAEGLDGCGLGQEAKVRHAFYTLIRRLTDAYHHFNRHELDKKVFAAYDYIQTCLLHLLDIQWQPYDLSFVSDIKLPGLFAGIAKETVKMRDCSVEKQEEEEEMKEYDQHMKWFGECSEGFINWYKKKEDLSDDEKKCVQMFIARFCDLLDVEVTCDGCGVTLPGRRYRCLQCVDMDLCATCYSGGVKPVKHTDDHDIIHLVYKCNKCQAFIVGTRIHCNVCEDFDLCLGCHLKENLPSGHLSSHDITKFPLTKLKTSQETDSPIQAYIHQHVWMLFTLLSLSMGDVVYSENSGLSLDQDYVKLAAELQNQCIGICTNCLQKVPDDAEDSSKNLLNGSERSLETRQEEAFAIHSQERIMGLLGAMIPRDTHVPVTGNSYNFMTADFLKLLFRISRGESGHEVNTRHLAMGLLGLLLPKCPSEVSDKSVASELLLEASGGQPTIHYLFSFGADCLQKSGLEWACSMARILQRLYNANIWRNVLHHHLTDGVRNIAQKPELASIFALFVMAGFPEVLTTGTLVHYNHTGVESKDGVVLKHYPDKHQTLVADVKTRKRHTVLDKYIDCAPLMTEVWDYSHITIFLDIIKEIVTTKMKGEEELSVENLWVLSLGLKLLNNSLKVPENCTMEGLHSPDFIQCLVYISSKGTGFSQQWLLKDLEVLSLMLYTHEGCTTNVKSVQNPIHMLSIKEVKPLDFDDKNLSKDDEENINSGDEHSFYDDTSSSESVSTSSSSSSQVLNDTNDEASDIFKELDERTKLMFKTLRHDLKVPISVLRVIYDMNDRNSEAVVKAIVDNFEGASGSGSKDDVKKLMEKWETILQSRNPETILATVVSDRVIDTGIHYHPDLTQQDRWVEKATEETAVDTQRLIQNPENNVQDEIIKQRRSKSAELLKKELEKHGKTGTREYLCKVNMAMSVLYARQVLTSLLAHWPETGHVINSNLLGCKEVQQIPCVLDLLNKTDSRENFQKVVHNTVKHCDTESLITIARTACQFMEEVTLSAVTHESTHDYKVEGHSLQKIQLPGASFLTVTFDSRCSTRVDEDELIFSTSSDLQQDRHVLSGSSRGHWNSFQIPGDTLFYQFICESGYSDTHWGYKFTVTAGTRDSFETGYCILNNVLSSHLAMSLPLTELWTSLVYVATKQTSTQRFKTIQLLLKIIQTQHRNGPEKGLAINLSQLKPLWQMYNSMTKQESDPGTILPPVVRALTELFLQVENLTIEWDVKTEYLLAMQDINDTKATVAFGIQRVAALSIALGMKNLAVELVNVAMKRKKT